MATNPVLAIGLMIVAGFLGGALAHRLKFPRITGYIIAGILLSPSILNIVAKTTVDNLDILISIALGIIAYSIGGNLHIPELRQLKKSIAWILPLETSAAWILVTLPIAFLAPFIVAAEDATFTSFYFPLAFILGAMATATAPGAIMAIVHELKAKGPLTTTLLSIVALDDAIAIVFFSIALGISLPLAGGAADVSLYQVVAVPLLEIIASLSLGAVLGFALIYIARLVKTRLLLLITVLGMLMLSVGITELLGLSLILANMVIGFVVANVAKRGEMFFVIDDIEDIVFILFFVLAGLHFDLGVIKVAGVLGLLITLGRFAGKYFGARAAARISRAPNVVRKYLGLALLPQAGIAIGLALLVESALPALGAVIFNGVLAAVILNEIIAPPLTEYAIVKAGEAKA